MRTNRIILLHLKPLVASLLLGLSVWLGFGTAALPAADTATGPWNMAALRRPPQATWGTVVYSPVGPDGKGTAQPPQAKPGETVASVQQVYYDGEPWHGKSTRIFAYYARPMEAKGPLPAILLVHGGGGRAFPQWAEYWAKRGYATLAMDTCGYGPAGRLSDGGPDQIDAERFRPFCDDEARDMWMYHAVADVIRGHSLLRTRPEIDPHRVGVLGVSWGGFLTCIVAGLDDRACAAVPVYGCGFIHENSIWVDLNFSKMTTGDRTHWGRTFDPSRYLNRVKCPMLFVTGSNDFAYPLDSYRKSYLLVPTPVTLSIEINRPHGHIWTFPEVDAFFDSKLRGGVPLPKLECDEDIRRSGIDDRVVADGDCQSRTRLHQ